MPNLNKNTNKLPRAVADGNIIMGNITIDCAVLEDGTQVITQSSMLKLMGMSNMGGDRTKTLKKLGEQGGQIPRFLAVNNLIPFIPRDLTKKGTHINFILKNGIKAKGYKAEIIPSIIDTYLDARLNGVLTKNQLPIAATMEIISRGFSRVGISALVYEACGIPITEKDVLQKILSEYISKELIPWVRRFPSKFFERYNKMYNTNKTHPHIGHFINKFIYGELAPGVLDELKNLNPIDEEKGRRLHTHHQFLTPTKGIHELDKQLVKVCSIMNLSKNREDFNKNYFRECVSNS